MTKKRDTTAIEAKRQAAAVERLTGEWFCHSAMHYTRAERTRWKGRRICVPCRDRIAALTSKQAPHG